jgi:hypothetical protein
VDPEAHAIPYVYTLDPHPMYECTICGDNEPHTFNKRITHMKEYHNKEIEDVRALNAYFKQLPTTRVFPKKPYFEPIYQYWLREPLMLVEKSRDMMATWMFVVAYSWDTLFHNGRQNFFQSETAPKTNELVKRVKFIYEHQPRFIKDLYKFEYAKGPAGAGIFECEGLNSEIIGFAQGSDQIRQYHPSGMLSDETAFDKYASETFAAIKPAIQNGGRYTGVSTAFPSWFQFAARDSLDQLI